MDAAALETRLLDALRTRLDGRRAYVCFSAGIDSTVVLAACLRLGAPTTALLAVGPALASDERAEAHVLAGHLGAELREIEAGESDRPGYRANAGDRCYHCKSALYDTAEAFAAAATDGLLLNGTQIEDLGDIRPGLKAAAEHGVFQPLVAAGFGKEAVRALARHWGLPNADKAASPCLASRFPVGVEVTPERLAQVEQVEAFLRSRGLWPARARWHEAIVRIELDPDLGRKALEEPLRSDLERACWRAGFRFPALDLGGLQSGSLAKALEVAP